MQALQLSTVRSSGVVLRTGDEGDPLVVLSLFEGSSMYLSDVLWLRNVTL